MATDIERLAVLIEANTKSYERAMVRLQGQTDKAIRGASKSISSLDKSLTAVTRSARTFASAFGAGILAGGIASIPSILRETVKSVADLGDTADKIGLTTDALQELEFAARQSGLSTEEVDDALTKFSRGLGQAASGGGELLKVFQANNIAITNADGSMRSFTELLGVYADLIKNAPSDQDRLNLSIIAFGRGGSNMANLTRDGAAGLAELQRQAREAGAVIDSDLVDSARNLDDQIQRLTDQFSVLAKSEILKFLQELVGTMGALQEATAFAVDKFNALSEAAGFLSSIELPSWFGNISSTATDILNPVQNATHALEALTQKAKELFPLSPNARIAQGFGGGGAGGNIPRITLHPQPVTNRAASGSGGGASAAEREAKKIRELISALQEELALIGKTDTEKRIANEIRRAGASATEAEKQQIAELVTQIEAQETAYDRLVDTLDTVRDAAGSALHAFNQSLRDGEGLAGGLKAALDRVLDTIIRIAEEQAIAALFGQFGGGGGGFFGNLIGSLFGGASSPTLGGALASASAHPATAAVHVVFEEGPLLRPTMVATAGAVTTQIVSSNNKALPAMLANRRARGI